MGVGGEQRWPAFTFAKELLHGRSASTTHLWQGVDHGRGIEAQRLWTQGTLYCVYHVTTQQSSLSPRPPRSTQGVAKARSKEHSSHLGDTSHHRGSLSVNSGPHCPVRWLRVTRGHLHFLSCVCMLGCTCVCAHVKGQRIKPECCSLGTTHFVLEVISHWPGTW